MIHPRQSMILTSCCTRSYRVLPSREGGYHWAGKQFISSLSPATQYRARVTAENKAGWSPHITHWNFATLGASPLSDSVTAAAPSPAPASLALLGPLLLLLHLTRRI